MRLFVQSILFLSMITGSGQYLINAGKNAAMNKNLSEKTRNYRWLALGDSYTIGESVKEDERFPAQTISLLVKENVFIEHLQYIATTGWTTLNLLNAIATQQPQGPFDVVTLLIGVNDQYQHMNISDYKKRFTECLEKAIV
ncbi:MAG: SGNH/GDSL hydrolase family protein, partial [Parafilimonas sp.]|nr:SGNH/GDSL hydrolase family protein [Parafilimonas sp.]